MDWYCKSHFCKTLTAFSKVKAPFWLRSVETTEIVLNPSFELVCNVPSRYIHGRFGIFNIVKASCRIVLFARDV